MVTVISRLHEKLEQWWQNHTCNLEMSCHGYPSKDVSTWARSATSSPAPGQLLLHPSFLQDLHMLATADIRATCKLLSLSAIQKFPISIQPCFS